MWVLVLASCVLLGEAQSSSTTTFASVKNLPGAPSALPFEHFAGQIQVNATCGASVFAWLAKSMAGKSKDVVVFLNGGPGSSSFLGWMFENVGPFTFVGNSTNLQLNPHAWNRFVDLIMFDQPSGVGLAWTSNACLPTNTDQSSAQLASAIEWLFAQPSLGLSGKKLWLFGESYAGTWIPLLAAKLQGAGAVQLGGMGVGDGWVNPLVQQQTYADYAYAHGLIGGSDVAATRKLQLNCAVEIESYPANVSLPSSVNDLCNLIEEFIVNVSNINNLDVRTVDGYDFSLIASYLNRPSVFAALNCPQSVASFPWSADSNAIGNLFAVGEQNSVDAVYSKLLTSNVKTLFYNGAFDMDCNFMGTDAWLEASEWGLRQNLAALPRQAFFLGETQVGMARNHGPMTQVVLFDAGHLVPHDIPETARNLMEYFVLH
jgi:carboxypeptidase C (cathepsin A)